MLLHSKWRCIIAINLIAIQAVFSGALAQNSTQNTTPDSLQTPAIQSPATEAVERSAEDAERLRIAKLRDATDTQFETAKQACYQKFAVNSCITQARAQQRSEITDLKRQEVALNDADRQRRGARQLQSTEAKNSPEVQAQKAQQRNSALAGAAQREENQAGKAAVQQSAAQTAQARSTGIQRKQADAAKAAAQRQAAASAQAAQSKTRYAERMEEAEKKRAKVLAKETNQPTKPPAAGLPIPPAAP